MKTIIKVDGEGFPCCKRYYYYSKHNLKCQIENEWPEEHDIKYAELKT